MVLYLGAKHEILLADGSLRPVGDLVGSSEHLGVGWFINFFRAQKIWVYPSWESENSSVPLWLLLSKDGRQLTCGNDTSLLSTEKGAPWITFHHSPDKSNQGGHSRYSLPSAAVNRIPIYGHQAVDSVWIQWVIEAIRDTSRHNITNYISIPPYLADLDRPSLDQFLKALKDEFEHFIGWRLQAKIPHINYVDQQRLFHLFDRIGSHRATPQRGMSRVKVDALRDISLSWSTRTAKIRKRRMGQQTKKSYLRKDPIIRYRPIFDDHAVRVVTQFGNLVDKNFICQTETHQTSPV